MALIAHQTQVSHPTLPLRPKPWTKEIKLKSFVAFQLVDRTDRLTLLKHRFCLRGQPIVLPNGRPFKVLSFKGNSQSDKSDCNESCSKFTKAPVQLACTQDERQDVSSDVQNHSILYTSEDQGENVTGSPAIQRLFRKWLLVLRTQTSSETVDGVESKKPAQSEISESKDVAVRKDAGKFLKSATVYFMRLDAAINLPLLIFIPLYLSVRVAYGAEVTKELTPLWILGPLILALYVKIIQGLCSLYVSCFMLAVRLAKNLPSYCLLVYSYIAEGKFRAFLWDHFWKHVVGIKNMDYKELLNRKMKQGGEWAVEKYLDYVESVWPYYWRTHQFLKKANLI